MPRNNLNKIWTISSVDFVIAVALQTKFSLWSKFSTNLGSMSKTSTHFLSTSRKHTTGFLMESFGGCCWSMVLTTACYWQSSHCIPAQKFVCLSVVLKRNFDRGCWTPTMVCAVRTSFHSLYAFDVQSQRNWRGCHCWKLHDQPFAFSWRFGPASIFSTTSSCTRSVFCCVRPGRNENHHWKGRGIMSLQKPNAVILTEIPESER